MSTSDLAVLVGYFTCLGLLAVYGLHRFLLALRFLQVRRRAAPTGDPTPWPTVTVQLPIFNERYVAERLIRAVAALDYPREKLEIQVLDDSTDDTVALTRRLTTELQREGVRIVHRHRARRTGFKAGALQAGLERAAGEFLAIFDADFLPPPDLLKRALPAFAGPDRERVGMVQVRWGHLNRDYSLLTKVQAILLDGHFVVEHTTRNRSGCFFNFNGTAGIWRRACIEDAGGWKADTLTEDLDLSYRAQLRGWRFRFLPDVVAPAELPVEINAFKSQQHRWAKGSIQTAVKLLPRLLRSRQPWRVKLEGFFHLTDNVSYLLLIGVAILLFPSVLIRYQHRALAWFLADFPLFLAASGSFIFFYGCAQRELFPRWRRQLGYLPVLMSIGIGLSINNARAVVEALCGRASPFTRTPKYRIEGPRDRWVDKAYRIPLNPYLLLELAFTAYFALIIGVTALRGYYLALPFLVLFLAGFGVVGLTSLMQPFLSAARRAR